MNYNSYYFITIFAISDCLECPRDGSAITILTSSVTFAGGLCLKEMSVPLHLELRPPYYAYFKMNLGDEDKVFAPHKICVKCLSNLSLWSKGKLKRMPFSTPMSWRD